MSLKIQHCFSYTSIAYLPLLRSSNAKACRFDCMRNFWRCSRCLGSIGLVAHIPALPLVSRPSRERHTGSSIPDSGCL